MEVAHLESNEYYKRANSNNLLFKKILTYNFLLGAVIGLLSGSLYLLIISEFCFYYCVNHWD